MPYHLMSHGRPIGRAGAELSGLAVGTRGWHFIPGPDFHLARSALAELQQATQAMQGAMPAEEQLSAMAADDQGDFVRRALITDVRASRFLAAMDAVEELALELRDETDALLPTQTLAVTELDLSPAAFREVLTAIDPASDPASSAKPPFYLLVAAF